MAYKLKIMWSNINSIGLLLLVFMIVLVSGCTSPDGVNVAESNGLKHFEGKGISFNAPNTWHDGKLRNTTGYLFSIYTEPVKKGSYVIDFYSASSNKTLSEAVSYFREDMLLRSNYTILSEKDLTVDSVPAYQIKALNSDNRTLLLTYFVKKGVVYAIDAIPNPRNNNTIETDLEMILNTFHTT